MKLDELYRGSQIKSVKISRSEKRAERGFGAVFRQIHYLHPFPAIYCALIYQAAIFFFFPLQTLGMLVSGLPPPTYHFLL